MRTAGCHLSLVRRIADSRTDVQFVTYDRAAYRRWLGSRPDSEALQAAWAVSRADKTRTALGLFADAISTCLTFLSDLWRLLSSVTSATIEATSLPNTSEISSLSFWPFASVRCDAQIRSLLKA